MRKLKNKLFLKATGPFEQVLLRNIVPPDVQRSPVIQRFEFTFELALKTLKDFYLIKEGLTPTMKL